MMSYLFRFSNTLTKFPNLLSPPEFFIKQGCPFCKQVITPFTFHDRQVFLHNVKTSGRMCLSTRTGLSESLRPKTKNRKKAYRKYVELIQIGDKNTNENLEKRAKVKKSSVANTLKQFGVTSTNQKLESKTTTSELEVNTTLETPSVDFFSASDSIERDEVAEELFVNDLINFEENSSLPEESIVSNDDKKTKTDKLTKKHTYIQRTGQRDKEETRNRIQKYLLPFLDVCVNTDKKWFAYNSLCSYHYRHLKNKMPLTDVRIYNCVLEAWTSDQDERTFEKIFKMMIDAKIKPNLQSYAYALQWAYNTGKISKIVDILNNIKTQGLDLNNIFVECNFVRNEREIILKAIRSKISNFEPPKRTKPQGYVCNLVESLNNGMPLDRVYNPLGQQLKSINLKKSAREQMQTEGRGFKNIRKISSNLLPKKNTEIWRKKLEKSEASWKAAILASFEKNLEQIRVEAKSRRNKRTDLYPYLSCLKPEEFVDLTFQEFLQIAQFSDSFSPVMILLHKNLGVKVMEKYFLHKRAKNGILEHTTKLYTEYCNYFTNPKLTSQYTPRQFWEYLKNKYDDGPDIDQQEHFWPAHINIGVGEFLYDIIQKDIKIDLNLLKHTTKTDDVKLVPAFYSIHRKHDIVKNREEIKPHPALSKFYRLADRGDLIFDANVLPMVSPPVPWSSVNSGGFLYAHTHLIRLPGVVLQQQRDRIDAMNSQNLYPSLDSLNQLAECPWIINKPILDIVITIFKNKGNDELDIPRPITECPAPPKININMSKQQVAKLILEKKRMRQHKADMFSLWCDMLYKLSIANEFRDKVLWFPHNMDFRGRVYPCPPHFNHLGSDVSRSLLLFAKGEPLGKEGLDWLKIHLINLTGTKKRCSLTQRLEYCNEMLPEIMDSADNPLTGNGWWKKSDEPWQTLACCMELTKALRSPDPYSYICHFPVHQDGSCNGLQHYAALGRDQEGAVQVNLEPSDAPQDVYSRIAEMVEEERRKDSETHIPIAKVLDGFISRRVVKQPVMTTVYGVTRYGARLQIMRQLKDLKGFPNEHMFRSASYLVSKTFYSLQAMFSATKEIQDWFTECAVLISKVTDQPVEWITPLGLPIVQPYFKIRKSVTKTDNKLKGNQPALPNLRKQKNAFPPNYIHSLDSTHMMLTSLFCQREGVSFVAVHDCFWTHPSSVATMNKICREQFVALHNEPLLEMLSQFLLKTYCSDANMDDEDSRVLQLKRVLSSVPTKGAFNLEHVLNSTYFFS